MSKDKISSQEMVDLVASKLSVSKRVAEEFLKSLFAEIEETLLKGESVKVKNLGTFKMQWNEPRKSVNVQTGEVFVIDGYNKVSFTPDSELKDAVNEPYSHLEPVELDGELPSFEIEKPAVGTGDTLRNLTEQASEIKDILSEINALSAARETKKAVVESQEEIVIPEYDLILLDEDREHAESKEQVGEVADNPINEEIEPIVEVIPTPQAAAEPEKAKPIEKNNEMADRVSEPFILGKKQKHKGLRFVIALFVILAIVVGAIYAVYFSSSCVRCWVEYDLLSETNRQKLSEYGNTFKGWFTSDKKETKKESTKSDTNNRITLPADVKSVGTDTIELFTEENTVLNDSLQMLFDSRREYTEYLGEEEITEGIRLTTISQRYYGKKDFWVYIYEANRDNIVHPDRITPGTIVKVPRVDPRLIDKKNPRCLQKAKELHDLYVGKK